MASTGTEIGLHVTIKVASTTGPTNPSRGRSDQYLDPRYSNVALKYSHIYFPALYDRLLVNCTVYRRSFFTAIYELIPSIILHVNSPSIYFISTWWFTAIFHIRVGGKVVLYFIILYKECFLRNYDIKDYVKSHDRFFIYLYPMAIGQDIVSDYGHVQMSCFLFSMKTNYGCQKAIP